jgi:Tfp pilus assembly protein PilX
MFFISRLRVARRVFRCQNCFPVARINNERGIALVLSLIMLVLLAILGTWVLNTSSTELRIAGNATNQENSFYCGESGLAYATHPDILKLYHSNAIALGNEDQSMPFPPAGPPITAGNCNYSGSIEHVGSGQVANKKGKPFDSTMGSVDTSNTNKQKFTGIFFIVDARNTTNNAVLPVQMGVQLVVPTQ